MDAVLLTLLKKELNTKIGELSTNLGQALGSSYISLNSETPITIEPMEEKLIQIDIPDSSMLITTMYFWCTDKIDIYQVKIVDSPEGFTYYDTGEIAEYSDAIFLLYEDTTDGKKLHMTVKNTNQVRGLEFNYKIYGLEVNQLDGNSKYS